MTRALAAYQGAAWLGPDQSEAGAGHGQASEPSPGGPGQWPLTRLEAAEDLSHRQEAGQPRASWVHRMLLQHFSPNDNLFFHFGFHGFELMS